MNKLTIAIPTYNRGKYLPKLLTSILNSKNENYDILVVDNASTDNTLEYMTQMTREYSQINYVRNEKNIGADGNFLKCYELALGEYVLLVGSDDYFEKNAIDVIIQFLETNPNCDFLFTNFSMFDESRQEKSKPFLNIDSDITLSNKNSFLEICDIMITFISCMVCKKELITQVENAEQYCGTHFIHTCLFFEATKIRNCHYGIIAKQCVAANITPGNGVEEGSFEVFGTCLYSVFMNIGVKCGFEEGVLSHIFYNFSKKNWFRWIINYKIEKKYKAIEQYRLCRDICLNEHRAYRLFLDFLLCCPRQMFVMLKRLKRYKSEKK